MNFDNDIFDDSISLKKNEIFQNKIRVNFMFNDFQSNHYINDFSIEFVIIFKLYTILKIQIKLYDIEFAEKTLRIKTKSLRYFVNSKKFFQNDFNVTNVLRRYCRKIEKNT